MKKTLLIFVFLLSLSAMAQPDDFEIKTIEGKQYYVHNVEQGNTLYGIQQLYKVDLEKILAANPSISNDLTIGQQILIPVEGGATHAVKGHIVASGETLYGISKKYNCTIDELKKLNPGIEDGLDIGQKVNIPDKNSGEVIQNDPPKDGPQPNYQISYKDSIVFHTVLAHETLYSISKRYMVSTDTIRALNELKGSKVKKGNVLKIPVKKVNYQILDKKIGDVVKDSIVHGVPLLKKDVYNVALMLPFMFYKNDAAMSKMLKIGQYREMYPTTKIAFEFYQGFVFAIDSLKKAGLNVNVYIYDTNRDTAAIAKILTKPEFTNMDLVVGPLYPKTIAYTAKRCNELGVNIILPFKTDAKVLHANPHAYKSVSSNMTLMDGSIDYILANHSQHNVVILKPYSDKDKALYERARDRFNNGLDGATYNSKIVELSLGSSGGRDLNSYLKKDTVNIVIVPSNNLKFVTDALNRLNKVLNMNPYAKKMKVVVFGFEDWNKFNDIDVLHRNRLNQHYATYRFVDYNSEKGLDFVKGFRGRTGTDPTVYSSQGFDIGMYFLSALHLYGVNFHSALQVHEMNLVQNEFQFGQIADDSGFENHHVSLVKYQNFQLIPCKSILLKK